MSLWTTSWNSVNNGARRRISRSRASLSLEFLLMLHRQVNVAAAISGKSLNAGEVEQLQNAVEKIDVIKRGNSNVTAKPKPLKTPNKPNKQPN